MPTLPADRNLTGEFGHVGYGGINGGSNQLVGGNYDTRRQFDGAYTGLNLENYGQALQGATGFGGAWAQANPGLAQYTQGLGSFLGQLQSGGGYQPTGYNATEAGPVSAGAAALAQGQQGRFYGAGAAAQAGFNPAQAYTSGLSQAQAAQAGQQYANGGPLLGQLQGYAGSQLGRISGLQAQQQGIAQNLLAQGGNLSRQELDTIAQDTRGAYAASGLGDSNARIGAEILNKDAARRARLTQNLGLAQGIDAAGQAQLQNNYGQALSAQNQGQQLSQFNAGQGNQINQSNAAMRTATSQFNAGEGNRVGMFNAQQQQQNSQFNSGLGAQVSQYNAGANNQMAQYNAGQRQQNSQFNAQLGQQNNQFNAGAQNQMGQYNAGLAAQLGMYNAGANNQAQQYNVGAVNQAGQFNAQYGAQNANDAWARALQYGQFQQQQAYNPYQLAGQLAGGTPDYTQGVMNYGQDLYNTNYNSQMSRYNSARNNSAGLWGAGLGAIGTIGGGLLGGPGGAAVVNGLGRLFGGN
jgi:hypothetical protein